MELKNKELDIIKFNQDFEAYDKNLKKYYEKPTIKTIPHRNDIDFVILNMRMAFDFLLNKIINLENPFPEISQNNQLMRGAIFLSFFIGALTLILSGLMK